MAWYSTGKCTGLSKTLCRLCKDPEPRGAGQWPQRGSCTGGHVSNTASDTRSDREHTLLMPVELSVVAASLPNTLEALVRVQFCPYPTQLRPFDTDGPVLAPSPTPSSAHTEGGTQHGQAGPLHFSLQGRRHWKSRDAGMRDAGLDPTAASCYLAMVLTFGMCELEAIAWPGLTGRAGGGIPMPVWWALTQMHKHRMVWSAQQQQLSSTSCPPEQHMQAALQLPRPALCTSWSKTHCGLRPLIPRVSLGCL